MKRILTGIQPSGAFHIGNYFGAMRPLIERQDRGQVFAIIVDLHALTSLRDAEGLREYTRRAAIDFLACGLDPERSVFFRQSDVPEHLQLMWILSTVTPMGLLERCHAYKDKVARGLTSNHALFAYPVLQAADILLYDADIVPVGKDQKQHLEVARDIVVKMNEAYGELFKLPQPEIAEAVATVPGLDGQKMSKSYGNAVLMRDEPEVVAKKVRGMTTDPARVRRTDPGTPEKCPVWDFHALYSDEPTRQWVQQGCTTAGIGCLDCKQPVIDAIVREQQPWRERAAAFTANPKQVHWIVEMGTERARTVARQTMRDVREAMGLNY
jgi:tryptophanyl-tRNA synthetase